jgi:protein tyrosine/serine phosphatase
VGENPLIYTKLIKTMKTYGRWLVLAVFGPTLIFTSYWGYHYETGNFHTVVVDQVYRSGQLDDEQLGRYITIYKLRSIVNLRGPNPGSKWYQDELRISEQFGIVHHDFDLSARHEVSDEDLDAILRTMRNVPKPILIHCGSGADRTGLIAAVYQYSIGHQTAHEAFSELSMLYGHFPYLGNPSVAMDRSYWRYVHTHAMPALRSVRGSETISRDGAIVG